MLNAVFHTFVVRSGRSFGSAIPRFIETIFSATTLKATTRRRTTTQPIPARCENSLAWPAAIPLTPLDY